MPLPIAATVVLEQQTCCTCGTPFAMEAALKRNLQRKGVDGTFHCPNGHAQHFADSELDKLRQELAAEKQKLEAMRARALDAEGRATRFRERHEEAERKLERAKKRAKAGVCPDCNRTFANVQRHLAVKHPEAKEHVAAANAAEKIARVKREAGVGT